MRRFRPWSVEDSVDPLQARLEPVLEARHFKELAGDVRGQAVQRRACERSPCDGG